MKTVVKGGRLKRPYCVVTHLTMTENYSYHIHEEDPIWDSTYMKLLHNLQDQYVIILRRTPNAGRKPVPGESAEYLILDKDTFTFMSDSVEFTSQQEVAA